MLREACRLEKLLIIKPEGEATNGKSIKNNGHNYNFLKGKTDDA